MPAPPDYVEVNERILEFRDKHPEGSLQAEIVSLTDALVVVKAYAYRTPDDPRPGTGLASEPIPGKTNFTRDSELMNCETSAWGRALIAVGAADAKRGIASANEVRNRQGGSSDAQPPSNGGVSEKQKGAIGALLKKVDQDRKAKTVEWLASKGGIDALTKQQASSLIGKLTEAVEEADGEASAAAEAPTAGDW